MKPTSTNGLRPFARGTVGRRRVLTTLGAGALVSSSALVPLTAFAQQPAKVWRVGFLTLKARPASITADTIGGFSKGMSELGYTEGKNLVIEWRFADGDAERLNGLAAELVRQKVDVLLASGPQSAAAAKQATSIIPIVMVVSNDPVASGMAASLARPGGNITSIARWRALPTRSSRAPSPARFRLSSPPRSNCSSTARPRKH